LTLTPYARVEYVDAKINAFQETGAPDPLQIESQRYKKHGRVRRGQAQYAISASWGMFVPFARLEYNHVAQRNVQAINAQIVGLPLSSALLPTLGTDKNYGQRRTWSQRGSTRRHQRLFQL
jgi:uncharacterized protein with beta-barrel porin domain